MYNQHNKRKKTKLKKCSKPNNKTSSIQKTLVMGSKSKRNLWELKTLILWKKYFAEQSAKQLVLKVQSCLQNKNKVMTELKLCCAQKEYVAYFYSNPCAVIRTQILSKKVKMKNVFSPHINPESPSHKIMQTNFQKKINFDSSLKNSDFSLKQNEYKKKSRILSINWDNSNASIKDLLSKLESMIHKSVKNRNFSNFRALRDISLNEINTEESFLNQSIEISTISGHTPFVHLENKQEVSKQLKRSVKIGETQPIKCVKKILEINDYGIPRFQENQNKVKRIHRSKQLENNMLLAFSGRKITKSFGRSKSKSTTSSTAKSYSSKPKVQRSLSKQQRKKSSSKQFKSPLKK